MIRTICRTFRIPYRLPHSATGPHIAYTAAQVAARKARWAMLGRTLVVCTVAGGVGAGGYQAARHAPASWLGLPEPLPAIHAPVPVWRGMPPEPTWRATGEPVHAVPVPEPGTGLILGFAVVGLASVVRLWRVTR